MYVMKDSVSKGGNRGGGGEGRFGQREEGREEWPKIDKLRFIYSVSVVNLFNPV